MDEDHERTLNQLHYEVKRKVSGAGDLLFEDLSFLMIAIGIYIPFVYVRIRWKTWMLKQQNSEKA